MTKKKNYSFRLTTVSKERTCDINSYRGPASSTPHMRDDYRSIIMARNIFMMMMIHFCLGGYQSQLNFPRRLQLGVSYLAASSHLWSLLMYEFITSMDMRHYDGVAESDVRTQAKLPH
jgi:hypothetical protein